MSRKEQIMLAALELGAEYGLRSVTLSRIADKVGIRKPSIYNHFSSKEQLLSEMYAFLRERARSSCPPPSVPQTSDLTELLTNALIGYLAFLSDKDMLCFFKVLYSERSTSPAAAAIMLEETERMVSAVRSMFCSLAAHGLMKCADVDTAALSYAMTVHSLVDRQMDRVTAGELPSAQSTELTEDMRRFIAWFAKQTEVKHDEK